MKRTYSLDAPDQQRLKIARAEIEGILSKHDLAGVVVLHTPGMTEFFYNITPSYSCVWIDEKAQQLRARSKLTDYAGDKEAQLRDQAATANMVHGLSADLAGAAGMFGSEVGGWWRLELNGKTVSEHKREADFKIARDRLIAALGVPVRDSQTLPATGTVR